MTKQQEPCKEKGAFRGANFGVAVAPLSMRAWEGGGLCQRGHNREGRGRVGVQSSRELQPRSRIAFLVYTEIGKKAWLFAKLQPGRARKRINAT